MPSFSTFIYSQRSQFFFTLQNGFRLESGNNFSNCFGTSDESFGTSDESFATSDESFGRSDESFQTSDESFATSDESLQTSDESSPCKQVMSVQRIQKETNLI
jgi:hypothetical protein